MEKSRMAECRARTDDIYVVVEVRDREKRRKVTDLRDRSGGKIWWTL